MTNRGTQRRTSKSEKCTMGDISNFSGREEVIRVKAVAAGESQHFNML